MPRAGSRAAPVSKQSTSAMFTSSIATRSTSGASLRRRRKTAGASGSTGTRTGNLAIASNMRPLASASCRSIRRCRRKRYEARTRACRRARSSRRSPRVLSRRRRTSWTATSPPRRRPPPLRPSSPLRPPPLLRPSPPLRPSPTHRPPNRRCRSLGVHPARRVPTHAASAGRRATAFAERAGATSAIARTARVCSAASERSRAPHTTLRRAHGN